MQPLLQEAGPAVSPEAVVEALAGEAGLTLLQSALFEPAQGRYSLLGARPFLTFRAVGSQCELRSAAGTRYQFGDPWRVLDALMVRYELQDELALPFPAGGCFGYWGYDLKNFVEPCLPRAAVRDLELPDCVVHFYASLLVIDHWLNKTWIVATGLQLDGVRLAAAANDDVEFWHRTLERVRAATGTGPVAGEEPEPTGATFHPQFTSNLTREQFIRKVEQAQDYIRRGDIYQVNLAQRLVVSSHGLCGWDVYRRLTAASPAPFAAYFDAGDFQIASSSPESFLRLSGSRIETRPIKGTRPRSNDPAMDAALCHDLKTSGKEMSELVMITDLMRNDLGRVCRFGSVRVPELVRVERYAQVQHLVSTVEGVLRPEVTHYAALASCFPGGSITGAPKIRAMQIIDELEPVTRGPYTGCLGYLGFNRESVLSIVIRTACCLPDSIYFHVGAGIVDESDPAAEYEETLAKARGFMSALAWISHHGVAGI